MTILIDRAKMTTATTGTGTVTLGSAVAAFQSFAAAGLVNGDVPEYLITDANAWEIGTGTYTSAGTTLTRVLRSSSTGSLLSLSGNAVIAIVPTASTFATLQVAIAAETVRAEAAEALLAPIADPLFTGTVTVTRSSGGGANLIADASGGSGNWANLQLRANPSGAASLQSYKGGIARWTVELGGSTAETGGNTGTDFALTAFADDGTLLGYPLTVERATGNVAITMGSLVVPQMIVQPGYSGGVGFNLYPNDDDGDLSFLQDGFGAWLAQYPDDGNVSLTVFQSGAADADVFFGVSFQFRADGGFNASNGLYSNGDALGLYDDGNGSRYLQFNPGWSWRWDTSIGTLSWLTNGQAVFTIDVAGNVVAAGSITATGALTVTQSSDGVANLIVDASSGSGDWANLQLYANPTGASSLQSYKYGLARWIVEVGGTTAETGGNAGTNFALSAFADDGTFLGQPIIVERATGNVAITTGTLSLINGSSLAPALQLGTADGTGFWRAPSNIVALGVAGSFIGAFSPALSQFYTPLSLLTNKIQQLGDATAATDALNMRTADARYAPFSAVKSANNSQSSSYALLATDLGATVTFTGSTASTISMTPSALGAGWFCFVKHAGTGTTFASKKLAITPASGTIDGIASITVYPGDFRRIWSPDGVNIITTLIKGGEVDILVSDSPAAFIVPSGWTWTDVELWAGGGGGGGGRLSASGTISTGGGGGGGGACNPTTFRPNDLVAGTTITVNIASSGNGGTGATVSDTSGSKGSTGSNSTFSSLLVAYGGGAGFGGSTSINTGGSGGGQMGAGLDGGLGANPGGAPSFGATGVAGAFGGASAVTGNTGNGLPSSFGGASGGGSLNNVAAPSGGSANQGGSGGGAGGGISVAPVNFAGGAGGSSTGNNGGGGTAGAAGTSGVVGGVGGSGVAGPTQLGPGTAGGGGGAGFPSPTLSSGGNGGNGGIACGGGGGGAGIDGAAKAGNGGQGGAGLGRIWYGP
jgi:hypothetical protein